MINPLDFIPSEEPELRVKSVFIFWNGMVAVCDENGEQMPQLQGRYSKEKMCIIRELSNEQTEWYGLNNIQNFE